MSEAPEEHIDLDRQLTDRLGEDDRFGSGVPPHLRGSDLDFIQMTGLTSPDVGPADEAGAYDDSLDPEMPVSFYEKGVDDVDTTTEPLGTEISPGVNDEIVVAPEQDPVRSSIASLREIVADLTRGGADISEVDAETQDITALGVVENEPTAEMSESEVAFVDANETHEAAPGGIAETEDAIENDAPEVETLAPNDSPDFSDEDDERISLADDPITPFEAEPTVSQAIVDLDDPQMQTGYTVTLSDDDDRADDRPPVSPASATLDAAESLLSKLERDMNVEPETLDESFEMPDLPEPVVPHDSEPEGDQSVYNRPSAPSRGRGHRRRSNVAERIARTGAYGVLAIILVGVSAYGYQVYWQQTASEHDLYQVNARHFDSGRYAIAAEGFESFANRYPGSPLGGDALFMAAQAHEVLGDTASIQRAAGLYQRFIDEYSMHPKADRASTLLGLNHVKTGTYDSAIEILGKPDLRKIDPEGYLAALRGLAISHAALGQVEEARSAYLRAASLEGNYSADRDYLALADMYMSEAESAATSADRIGLTQRAIEQWDFAARVPGITETRRREIRMRRDVAMEAIGARTANNAVPEAVTVPDAPTTTSLEERYEQEQQRLMTID